MLTYSTEFHPYSVEFSPFEENKLAVGASQHFGIVGNGRQFILQLTDKGIRELAHFDTQDGVYDCSWSESNENHLLSGIGDGMCEKKNHSQKNQQKKTLKK